MLDREQLHEKLHSFDIAIVPLKTRIFGSVPSKIFEYTTLGFPVLYFGGGEGGTVVLENNLGWVAEVGDYDDLNQKLIEISTINKLKLEAMKKSVFETSKAKFNLNKQVQNLLEKKVF
jgi:glycosyltransferase involved in cell wall biosynthesis